MSAARKMRFLALFALDVEFAQLDFFHHLECAFNAAIHIFHRLDVVTQASLQARCQLFPLLHRLFILREHGLQLLGQFDLVRVCELELHGNDIACLYFGLSRQHFADHDEPWPTLSILNGQVDGRLIEKPLQAKPPCRQLLQYLFRHEHTAISESSLQLDQFFRRTETLCALCAVLLRFWPLLQFGFPLIGALQTGQFTGRHCLPQFGMHGATRGKMKVATDFAGVNGLRSLAGFIVIKCVGLQ